MKIHKLTAMHVRIALKKEVRHASYTRTENDTLLIRCQLDDGTVGWGESLPRDYVTGESIESVWQHIQELASWKWPNEVTSVEEIDALINGLPLSQPPEKRDCFGNCVRCAVELALLDAFGRSVGEPISKLIRQHAQAETISHEIAKVRYSAAITGSRLSKVRLRCWLFRLAGFRTCKVKVGFQDVSDRSLVELVRGIMGRKCRIRIDANEAWTLGHLAERLSQFDGLRIESAEQPIPHGQIQDLDGTRGRWAIPIMLDESLCSWSDGQIAIEKQRCDAFNLRISKCGGILNVLRLARLAHDSGMTCQLGCQVGETGILSAAGRHVAASIAGLTAVEGSFDRFLVKDRLTQEDLTFGLGGLAPALSRPGLGITVDETAVERVLVKELTVLKSA